MSMSCKTEEIVIDNVDYNSDDADENIRIEDSGGDHYHTSYSEELQHQMVEGDDSPLQNIITVSVGGKTSGSSKNMMENEKRMRREIANSNERRRMQSINAGFQSLRSLLPHHEGEKLSKAAILQQTAQYIIDLEREKTHLLSQNSQLKRVLGQHEGSGASGGGGGGGGTDITTGTTAGGPGAIKKRKLTDNVISVHAVSDSSDEGLGSMSPEPVTLLNGSKTGTAYISTSSKEIADLKARLENERKRRLLLEDRLRQVERQMYPQHQQQPQTQYIQREVIEHTDNIREEEIEISVIQDRMKLQVVDLDSPHVVLCSSEAIHDHEDSETITSDEMLHGEVCEEIVLSETTEYVEVPSRLQPILEAAIKAEPKVEVERINATLTKIKDDQPIKVDGNKPNGNGGRMYLTSTSRQNLETIVEAIRHLEGDHLFNDSADQKKVTVTGTPAVTTVQQKPTKIVIQQEVPLALTNKPQQQQQQHAQRKQLSAELSPFLQLKAKPVQITKATPVTLIASSTGQCTSINNSLNSNSNISNNNTNSSSTAIHQITSISPASSLVSTTSGTVTLAPTSLKQCRPGVIVAKKISS